MRPAILRYAILFILLLIGAKAFSEGTFTLPEKEVLNYSVYFKWGFIQKLGGKATLTMKPAVYKGKPARSIDMGATTTPLLDKIMRVRDTLKTYTTPEMLPLYYGKVAREGNYYGFDEIHYSYRPELQVAYQRIFRKGKFERDTTFYSRKQGWDMMTLFYRIRTYMPRKVGEIFSEIVFSDNQIAQLEIVYKGAETMTTLHKKSYDALRFEVIFNIHYADVRSRERMTYWVTNDNRRLPIQLRGDLPIGSLCAVLD